MAAPSKSYTGITDSQVDADSPLDTTLMTALRDNIVHVREWLGGSYTAAVDHDHDGVNSKPVAGLLYVAGDVLLLSAYTLRSTTLFTPEKKKEFAIIKGGALRIKFDLYHSSGGSMAYGRIYRNGAPVGTLQSTNSVSAVTFSEDISGWNVDDLVQLYIYTSTSGGTTYCQNFLVSVSNGTVNID
ncbi:MAG: hypothetical protein ACE5GY_07760 [Thermodesulfobacteriota bacterium]